MIAAAIGFHDTGIDREPFALDEPCIHARPHHRLEQLAENIAVTETTMAIDRECRVIGYLVLQTQPAKPTISEVQLDLLAQLPLRADPIAVTDDQHRIMSSGSTDGRPSSL